MEGFTLTIIDTTGIQDYIFGSNKLKENIGASHLLMQVSSGWLYEALEQMIPGAHNFDTSASIATRALEDYGDQQIEVIYSGGGNIVLLSRTEDMAKDAVRAISRTILERAPGLEISAAHHVLDENEAIGGTDGAYNDLLRTLNRTKQQRRQSTPQLGLSVTMECRATGLPATHFDEDEKRFVSSEIWAKLAAVNAANDRLQKEFGDIYKAYAFGTDFDDFGRSRDDSSYIAVIHADGNGMGQRFEQLVTQFGKATQNRACLDALRAMSHAVETSGKAALKDTIERLNHSFSTHGQTELDDRMRRFATGLQQHKRKASAIFPVRPLVFGGDDLTLVCDGRLGLALAAVYLKAFHTHTSNAFAELNFPEIEPSVAADLKKPAYACAGVAVVKAHYPFARAYALSSALCDHAKSTLRKSGLLNVSAMDWYFAASGISASLGELRKQQYLVDAGDLTMRPITVGGSGFSTQPWREWHILRDLIEKFVNNEEWRERHNKVVALREALRVGEDEVKRFRHNYKIGLLPELNGRDEYLRTTGWSNRPAETEKDNRSGYFDAIEALEFYLPIEQVIDKEAAS